MKEEADDTDTGAAEPGVSGVAEHAELEVDHEAVEGEGASVPIEVDEEATVHSSPKEVVAVHSPA